MTKKLAEYFGAKDLHSAARPLLRVLYVLGLSHPPPKHNEQFSSATVLPTSRCESVIQDAVLLTLQLAAVYLMVHVNSAIFNDVDFGPFVKITESGMFISEGITIFVAAFTSKGTRRIVRDALTRDAMAMDKVLLDHFPKSHPYAVGSLLFYSLLVMLIIIQGCAMSFATWWIEAAHIESLPLFCFAVFCRNFLYVVSLLYEFLFLGCVMYLWQKYKWIDEGLDSLMNFQTAKINLLCPKLNENRMNGRDTFVKIHHLRRVHFAVVELSALVSKSFAPLLLANGISFFLGLMNDMYVSLTYILRSLTFQDPKAHPTQVSLLSIFNGLSVIIRLFALCACCHASSTRAAAILSTIRRLQLAVEIPPYQSIAALPNATRIAWELKRFVEQVTANPLSFSACGFFVYDFRLMVAIVSAVVTYLVILLQSEKCA